MPLITNLGKYLGMQLLHERSKKSTSGFIIKEVKCRFCRLEEESPYQSRKEDIQTVTSVLPQYAMQTAKLPVAVAAEVEKLNRDSFWGHDGSDRRLHTIEWSVLCQKKEACVFWALNICEI